MERMVGSSLPDVERFLTARLAAPLPGAPAQRRFAPDPPLPGWSPDLLPEGARRAAALILLYPGAGGPIVPLTVRHAALPHHPGQVSLPGGAIGPGESPRYAALREAEEEIGVAGREVRVLGALSTLWVAVSNFVVHPFVGLVDQPPRFRLHPDEVEALVEVPLLDLCDPTRVGWSVRPRRGHPVRYPHLDLAGHVVWGATAIMLGEFTCLFSPDHAPPAAR
jgi:8-oxo-dGTP pyrophosphatase MutT (NUDIX family)